MISALSSELSQSTGPFNSREHECDYVVIFLNIYDKGEDAPMMWGYGFGWGWLLMSLGTIWVG
jgi:hypothetical protein